MIPAPAQATTADTVMVNASLPEISSHSPTTPVNVTNGSIAIDSNFIGNGGTCGDAASSSDDYIDLPDISNRPSKTARAE